MKTKAAFEIARAVTGQDKEPNPEKFNGAQGQLPGTQAATPKPVRDGKMMMEFVKPVFDRSKRGEPIIGLDMSFPLTDDHEGLLPSEVEDNWKVIRRDNCKRIDVSGISPQQVRIYLVPDDNDELSFVADVAKATLSVVNEKGKGKTKKVIRLQLRLMTERTKALRDFIWNSDGEFCWVKIAELQGKLI